MVIPPSAADNGKESFFRVGDSGFISAWLKLGPFYKPGKRALPLSEIARTDPLKPADLGSPPRHGQLKRTGVWEAVFDRRKGVSLSRKGPAVAFLAAVLEAPKKGRYLLATGSDDALEVWLNGKQRLERHAERKGFPDTDLVALELESGRNLLVLKLAKKKTGRWRLFARLMNEDFSPARDLAVVLPGAPPNERAILEKTGRLSLTRKLDLKKSEAVLNVALAFSGARPSLGERFAELRFVGGENKEAKKRKVTVAHASDIDLGSYRFDSERSPHEIEVTLGPARFKARTGFRMHDVRLLAGAVQDLEKAKALGAHQQTSLESVAWRIAHLTDLVEAGDEDWPYLNREIGFTVKMARRLAEGDDPYKDRRAQVQRRGYLSKLDGKLHYYALYVPPGWREDGDQRFGLVVALHGMGATPMKAMQAVFGRPLDEGETKVQKERFPKPIDGAPFFVLAPEGFGNAGYIAFGEVDVLDAIEAVKERYRIDEDRVYVTGASMGGIGAASLPLHFPDRFAAAAPLCGYHSQFVRSKLRGKTFLPWERFLLEDRSHVEWAVNGRHLPLWLVHGTKDSPIHSRVLAERYRKLKQKVKFETPEAGHNVWDWAYQNRRIFKHFKPFVREVHPRQVAFRTSNLRYRTNRWLSIDDVNDYARWSAVDGEWREDGRVEISTDNIAAFSVKNDEVLRRNEAVQLSIDGDLISVGAGARAMWQFVKENGHWQEGTVDTGSRRVKRPGLAGPIRDIFFEPLLFVYGTADKAEEVLAKRLISVMKAPKSGTTIDWPVKADTEVTDEDIASKSLVIVGTASGNQLLARIAEDLPIRVKDKAVAVGETHYTGKAPAAAFIHPNPLNRDRYVLVHTGVSLEALFYAAHLPTIVPDYIVYDGPTWQWKQGKILDGRAVLAAGFFDKAWRVKTSTE